MDASADKGKEPMVEKKKRPVQVDERIDFFLKENPLDEEYASSRGIIEYRFYYDLQAEVRDLWPLLSDTSEINRRLGLSNMKFREEGGRLYGRNRVLGMPQEWEEVPWQWEAENFLTTERIYSRGPLKYVRGTYLLDFLSPGATRLIVYFLWVPRDIRGRIIFTLSRSWLEKNYRRVMEELADQAGSRLSVNIQPVNYLQTPEIKKTASVGRGLQKIRDQLLKLDLGEEMVSDLVHFVSSAPGHELYRIRPRVLARSLNRELRPFLEVMLHATRGGLLNMTWDVVCPHCRGVRERIEHLWEVPKTSSCEVCNIDFDTTGINSLEIAFTVNPEIRKVEEVFYCSAEPSKKSHIRFQTVSYTHLRAHET